MGGLNPSRLGRASVPAASPPADQVVSSAKIP